MQTPPGIMYRVCIIWMQRMKLIRFRSFFRVSITDSVIFFDKCDYSAIWIGFFFLKKKGSRFLDIHDLEDDSAAYWVLNVSCCQLFLRRQERFCVYHTLFRDNTSRDLNLCNGSLICFNTESVIPLFKNKRYLRLRCVTLAFRVVHDRVPLETLLTSLTHCFKSEWAWLGVALLLMWLVAIARVWQVASVQHVAASHGRHLGKSVVWSLIGSASCLDPQSSHLLSFCFLEKPTLGNRRSWSLDRVVLGLRSGTAIMVAIDDQVWPRGIQMIMWRAWVSQYVGSLYSICVIV